MLNDLAIYQKTYDFTVWLHPLVNKFPKSQRFVRGKRIENKTIDVMHSFVVVNVERDTAPETAVSLTLAIMFHPNARSCTGHSEYSLCKP